MIGASCSTAYHTVGYTWRDETGADQEKVYLLRGDNDPLISSVGDRISSEYIVSGAEPC